MDDKGQKTDHGRNKRPRESSSQFTDRAAREAISTLNREPVRVDREVIERSFVPSLPEIVHTLQDHIRFPDSLRQTTGSLPLQEQSSSSWETPPTSSNTDESPERLQPQLPPIEYSRDVFEQLENRMQGNHADRTFWVTMQEIENIAPH